jgi:hypothetical protein
MITERAWVARKRRKSGGGFYYFSRKGWFLFGLLPLYIRDRTLRNPWCEVKVD